MSRKHIKHYAGASSKLTPSALAKLGPAFMVQPKIDGAYCHLHLDATGQIARVTSRTGNDYTGASVDGLIGQFVGYAGAVLIGELTAHTTSGNLDAKTFGARRVHLFDMAFGADTRPLAHLPYSERRAELFRMQAAVDAFGPGQSWRQTRTAPQSKRSGRFCRKTHRGTALTPIVPQVRAQAASELWDQVKAGTIEGLVAVSQNAPLGRRGSKRKCKLDDTIDVLILGHDARLAGYLYGSKEYTVTRGKCKAQKGDMVSLKHNGFYPSGEPRFARIERIRHDLMVDC